MRRMRKAWGYRSVLAGLGVGLTMTGGSVMAADEAKPAVGQAAGQGGAAAPAQVDGLLTIRSRYSVSDSIKRVQEALLAKGLTVFTVIDHQKAAQQHSLEMPAASVIIFGNPKVGTPMMVQSPTLAIDLPSKVLVWEDSQGNVYASMNTAAWMAQRHHLPPEVLAPLAGLEKLIPATLGQ